MFLKVLLVSVEFIMTFLCNNERLRITEMFIGRTDAKAEAPNTVAT